MIKYRHTVVVGADLECLLSSHNQPDLGVLLVLEQSNISSATFLPLAALTVKLEELGPHLEDLFLGLFVGLGLDLLREMYDGLEVNVRFLLINSILLQKL